MTALEQWPLQTMANRDPMLLGLAFAAPLVALSQRWPRVLHAVTLEGVLEGGFGTGSFTSACGRSRLRLMGRRVDGAMVAALWPPTVRGMPETHERCRTCWEQTGKQRPRTVWA